MKTIIAIILSVTLLSACSSSPEVKAKWGSTGQWLLQKAVDVAVSSVVAASTSQADASNKADWLDSLGQGLRTEATASFSGDDVRKLIGIWTPEKPHWQDLGAQLAELTKEAAGLPPEQRAEILAKAVQLAAEAARNRTTVLD